MKMNLDKKICLVYSEFLDHEAGIGRDMEQVLQDFKEIGVGLLYKKVTSNKLIKAIRLFSSFIVGPKNALKIDFAYAPHIIPKLYRVPHLVRVHDIFPITNPEWFKVSSRIYFKLSLKSHRNSHYLFDSNTSKDEFINHVGQLEPNRYSVMYCKLRELQDNSFCNECKACLEHEKIVENDFALAVGTIEPRKNYSYILNNWESSIGATRNKLPLYVIGEYGWKSGLVRRKLLVNNQDVRWLGKVCDSSLKYMYSSAKVFISASKAEGFNLPVREALSFGVPVVISKIPIHKELYTDEAFFFTFESTESFKKAIISAINAKEKVNPSIKMSDTQSNQSATILRKAIEKVVQ